MQESIEQLPQPLDSPGPQDPSTLQAPHQRPFLAVTLDTGRLAKRPLDATAKQSYLTALQDLVAEAALALPNVRGRDVIAIVRALAFVPEDALTNEEMRNVTRLLLHATEVVNEFTPSSETCAIVGATLYALRDVPFNKYPEDFTLAFKGLLGALGAQLSPAAVWADSVSDVLRAVSCIALGDAKRELSSELSLIAQAVFDSLAFADWRNFDARIAIGALKDIFCLTLTDPPLLPILLIGDSIENFFGVIEESLELTTRDGVGAMQICALYDRNPSSNIQEAYEPAISDFHGSPLEIYVAQAWAENHQDHKVEYGWYYEGWEMDVAIGVPFGEDDMRWINIEIDGWAHRRPFTRWYNSARDNFLKEEGWEVVRVPRTHYMRVSEVMEIIEQYLAETAAQPAE